MNTESVLPSIVNELCRMRTEAVNGRAASGIEDKWEYAEKAYNGQDEATEARTKMYKPGAPDSGFIAVPPATWKRSTAFLNITRPYTDSSASRIIEMIMPTDERNWELENTPKLDSDELLQDVEHLPPEGVKRLMEMIQESTARATQSLMETQKQIDDWLTESDWRGTCTDTINNAARIGTGVIKGPVPMNIKGKIQPGSKVIEAQNCYPDPHCGEDIHDGEYFWEREDITRRKLRKKRQMVSAGWLSNEINACLDEGPKSYNGMQLTKYGKPQTNMFELWYYQGELKTKALVECGCTVPPGVGNYVWANVTLCNDKMVRISLAPVQDRFTYDVFRWQKRKGSWTGIGVGEQLETCQRGLNAGIRNIFDNAALCALPQLIYWQGKIIPLNGRYELEPGKSWKVDDSDGTITFTDVKNAILTIEIPSRIPELLQIVDLMRNVSQETVGLPLIMQGLSSTGAVGSDQIQTNAGNTVLRRLAVEFDVRLTIPHLTAYYNWIRDFNVLAAPESTIKARGSSVLVERDIQAQALIQMVQLARDPIYGMDPELVAEEWVRSQKFDPRKLKLSEQRRKELSELLSQPDEKAQATVESAKLRASALMQQTQTEATVKQQRSVLEAQSAERDRQHDQVMLDLQFKYELIKYAMERKIDIATALEQLNEVKDAA